MTEQRTKPRNSAAKKAATKAERRQRAAAARRRAELRRLSIRWGVGLVVAALVIGGLYWIFDTSADKGSGGGSASGYKFEVGAPGPGEMAPDFSLPATSGETVKLSDYRGKTVLLYFHEGAMCQPCFDQIRDLERESGKLTDAGIDELVTVTVDPLDRLTQKMRDEKLTSVALSDPDLAVSKQYEAQKYGMMNGTTPGHSFLRIDPDGRITWRADYGGAPDYTMYLPVDAVLKDMRAAKDGGEQ